MTFSQHVWKMTEEEAGRKVRYEAFRGVVAELGYQKIAVAHNENDSAETFLFQGALLGGLHVCAGGALKL